MAFFKRLFQKRKDRNYQIMTTNFNMENILLDFSDEMKKNIQFIHSLTLIPKKKIAFHGADADGIVSALILKFVDTFSDAIFLPLGYQEIRHPEYGFFLGNLNWIAIVDLPPFNTSEIILYADHHLTNKSLVKRAKNILFDENGLSTANLLANYYHSKLTDEVNLLADLTKITDTAGYLIDPPTDLPKDFPENKDEQAWLLNDLCQTPNSTVEVLSLLQDLFEYDLNVFESDLYRQKILKLRNLRKLSMKFSEKFEPADVVIIVRGTEQLLTSTLISTLFKQGVKIMCIMYPGQRFTGLSFRVNSNIPNSDIDFYRVDNLASRFSGGGHPRAAGGRGHSFEETKTKIINWIKERQLSYNFYDLRYTNK